MTIGAELRNQIGNRNGAGAEKARTSESATFMIIELAKNRSEFNWIFGEDVGYSEVNTSRVKVTDSVLDSDLFNKDKRFRRSGEHWLSCI